MHLFSSLWKRREKTFSPDKHASISAEVNGSSTVDMHRKQN